GGDVLVFSKGEWAVGSNVNGLTNGDGSTVVANGNVVFGTAASGGTINASADLLEMTGNYANAAALATALHGSSFNLANNINIGVGSHILVAYQDTTGSTHIADVDFFNNSASPTGL